MFISVPKTRFSWTWVFKAIKKGRKGIFLKKCKSCANLLTAGFRENLIHTGSTSQLVLVNSLFATFADLHRYTHAYGSFILLNEAITIGFGSHCLHALLMCLFWKFPFNLQVKRYSELNIILLNVAPILVLHTGDLYVANKELNVPFKNGCFQFRGQGQKIENGPNDFPK